MLDISATGKLVLAVAVPTTMVFVYWLLKKNEDDEEEDNMSQITTSRQTVIEVKVPKDAVGTVIGRQGTTIKQLQQDSGARIKFKDRDTSDRDNEEDRTVVIHGSPDAAQAAEIMVREIIANMPVIRSQEMYVPVRCLGRLIGRNGDSIRQMCRTSKAKIKIDPKGDERDPNSLKLIVITGGDQQIEMAKSLIEEKIQEDEAFRARTAVLAANREHRNTRRKDATQTQSVPVRHSPMSVPVGAESWDVRVTDESEWADHQDSYMEVYMSAVENPGHFWVQIISSKAAQLDQLITEMSMYYSQLPPEDPSLTTFNVGDVVAVPFPHDSSWYRARILGFEGDKVDLYYVDFGDNGLLDTDQIRSLRGDFLSLPFQAIECYLANIKPTEAGWTEQACVDFEEMTYCAQWKVIMAKTIRYKPSEHGLIPCLHIIDTNGDQDVDVNAELVRRGYGDWDPEPPRASAGGLGDLTQVSIGNQVTATQRECMALHGFSPLGSSVGNENCSAQNDNSPEENKNHSAESKDNSAEIENISARTENILAETEDIT